MSLNRSVYRDGTGGVTALIPELLDLAIRWKKRWNETDDQAFEECSEDLQDFIAEVISRQKIAALYRKVEKP